MSKRLASPRSKSRGFVKKTRSKRSLAEHVPATVHAQTLADVMESLESGVAVVTPQAQVIYANRRFAEALGLAEGTQVVGKKLTGFVENSSAGALRRALLLAKRGPAEGQLRVQADEREEPQVLQLSLAPLDASEHPLIRIVATETTLLVRTKRALASSEASLRDLSARLLQVQDEERRRLARDLHDTTGQEIALVLISLARVAKEIEKASPHIRDALAESVQWIRKIETEIRTLSYLLHPPLLDETGLAAALEWFVEGFKKRTGIQVALEIEPDFPRLSSPSETALFRVVQESLSNVLRHSGSASARVWLAKTPTQVRLSIEDSGKGFPRNGADRSVGGVGIQGMTGRLAWLGGMLDVASSVNGTTVVASVPYVERDVAVPAALDAPLPDSESEMGRSGGRKRILIADDQDVARRGLCSILSTQPDLEVCGEAFDGEDAVRKTAELRPDLVILDLSMPGGGGTVAAMRIRKMTAKTKVLLYSSYVGPTLEHVLQRIPCDGYVPKSNASEDLVRAIYTVLAGGSFFGGAPEKAASA